MSDGAGDATGRFITPGPLRRHMTRYTIETPDGPERGVRVTCEDHGESAEFPAGHRKGTFYCERCGAEVTVDVRDAHDWRDTGEMC